MQRPHSMLVGKSCLVVDDELLIALDIEQILLAAGAASVICLASAEEALASVHGSHFDVAVLDVLLRGAAHASFSVAAALQLRNTPFVFLTGMRRADLRMSEYPAAPVVEKPYQPSLLIDAVVRALTAR